MNGQIIEKILGSCANTGGDAGRSSDGRGTGNAQSPRSNSDDFCPNLGLSEDALSQTTVRVGRCQARGCVRSTEWLARRSVDADFLLEPFAQPILLDFQVISRLQSQPESFRQPEEPLQAQRRIG